MPRRGNAGNVVERHHAETSKKRNDIPSRNLVIQHNGLRSYIRGSIVVSLISRSTVERNYLLLNILILILLVPPLLAWYIKDLGCQGRGPQILKLHRCAKTNENKTRAPANHLQETCRT